MSDVFGKTLDFFWKISDVFLRKSLNFIRSLDSNSGWLWRLWKQKVHHRCSVRMRARNSLLCLRCFWKLSQRNYVGELGLILSSFVSSMFILYCCTGELLFSTHNPSIPQIERSEEHERGRNYSGKKALFKVWFAMRMYQNDLFVKKKVQFSGDFSLFAPLSTPICVGRWMKRTWGYEEE